VSAPIRADKAHEKPCPLARAYAPGHLIDGSMCIGGNCLVWRWRPLMVDDPGYAEAVKKAAEDGMKRPGEAQKFVSANRKALGLNDKPYLGWCGLGGGATL
jgi:hypothetical protein